jgi:hypothetical protein
MTMLPNRFQRATLDLIEATEENWKSMLSPADGYSMWDTPEGPGCFLRNHCTVGLLLPSRSGKTSFVMHYQREKDDAVMFKSERDRNNFIETRGIDQSVFKEVYPSFIGWGVKATRGKKLRYTRLYVMEPFWNKMKLDRNLEFYQVIARMTDNKAVTIVLLDTPF